MNYPGKTKEEDNAEQKTPRASLKKKSEEEKDEGPLPLWGCNGFTGFSINKSSAVHFSLYLSREWE